MEGSFMQSIFIKFKQITRWGESRELSNIIQKNVVFTSYSEFICKMINQFYDKRKGEKHYKNSYCKLIST